MTDRFILPYPHEASSRRHSQGRELIQDGPATLAITDQCRQPRVIRHTSSTRPRTAHQIRFSGEVS